MSSRDPLHRVAVAVLTAAGVLGGVALVRKVFAQTPPPSGVYFLDDVQAAPFPRQPGPKVALLVPPGFDPDAPLDVVLYLRGVGNCIENLVGDRDGQCAGESRRASHLATQLAESGSRALVIMPELELGRGIDPGALGRPGGTAALLAEVVSRLPTALGRHTPDHIHRLSVMCHSGGYRAAAAVLRDDPPELRSVVLLDALYAEDATFLRWIQAHAASFTPEGGYRFADVYTDEGGTDARSQALADRVIGVLRAAGTLGFMLDDATADTLAAAAYRDSHVIFKRSALTHTDVSRYYPQQFWAAGW